MRAWFAGGRGRGLIAGTLGISLMSAALLAVVALRSDSGPQPVAPGPAHAPTSSAPSPTLEGTQARAVSFTHFGLLDGVGMTDTEWAKRKDFLPLAVMFDNSSQAFPHDGLHRADLIYEAFVEGGITRLMAVYWRQDANFLEPIRSARTPFVVWADELDALFAHGGAAATFNEANAAGQIYAWEIKDLDAFGPIAAQYYRDPDRRAPHDLATSTAKLRAAAAALGFAGPGKFEPWLFRAADAALPAGEPARGVEVDFGGTQRVQWQTIQYRWDAVSNRYGRFQYGGPHLDARSKEQLTFTTVIAMRTTHQVVDGAGHVLIDQVGSGTATVFTDGVALQASWKKADRKARTRFYDSSGVELRFGRGPILIEVLGPGSTITVKPDASQLLPLPEYILFTGPFEPDETATPSRTGTPAIQPGGTPSASSPATATASVSPSPATSGTPSSSVSPTRAATSSTSPTSQGPVTPASATATPGSQSPVAASPTAPVQSPAAVATPAP